LESLVVNGLNDPGACTSLLTAENTGFAVKVEEDLLNAIICFSWVAEDSSRYSISDFGVPPKKTA
jgi:hypothetical protein